MTLHLLPKPAKPPRTKREQVQDRLAEMVPTWMLKCPRCGSLELVETRTGVISKNGRPSGGTKTLLCLHCMVRGERVVVR